MLKIGKMRIIGFLLLFFVFYRNSYFQVTFEAKLSKKKLGLNERLRIDFVMNENGMILLHRILKDLMWLET